MAMTSIAKISNIVIVILLKRSIGIAIAITFATSIAIAIAMVLSSIAYKLQPWWNITIIAPS
jgi:hypothetical protein